MGEWWTGDIASRPCNDLWTRSMAHRTFHPPHPRQQSCVGQSLHLSSCPATRSHPHWCNHGSSCTDAAHWMTGSPSRAPCELHRPSLSETCSDSPSDDTNHYYYHHHHYCYCHMILLSLYQQTALPSMLTLTLDLKLIFNPQQASHNRYTCKNHGQRSRGSNISGNKWTDGCNEIY